MVTSGAGSMGAPLDNIKFYGVLSAPSSVTVDGSPLDASKYIYDTGSQVGVMSHDRNVIW